MTFNKMINKIVKAVGDNYEARLYNRTNWSKTIINMEIRNLKANYKRMLENQTNQYILQQYEFWFGED